MTNKNLNILKKKTKIYKKIQLKKKLLKSIIQNNSIHSVIRCIASKRLIALKKKINIHKNICMQSGSFVSVNNKIYLSRFQIKKLMLRAKLDNFIVN